jgi:hypothetical protein
VARQLRAYTYELCDSWLPRDILDVVGDKPHVHQGRLLVFARTAKDAMNILKDLGLCDFFHSKPPRIATGNDLDALISAGLATEGAVFVISDHTRHVALVDFQSEVTGSLRRATLIGEIFLHQLQARFVPISH